jgi:hypothetical protein
MPDIAHPKHLFPIQSAKSQKQLASWGMMSEARGLIQASIVRLSVSGFRLFYGPGPFCLEFETCPEVQEQLDRLRELGCDQYQGFYSSAAVPAADIEGSVRPADFQFTKTQSKLAAFKVG